MNPTSIGNKLRDLRYRAGFSVETAIEQLHRFDIYISNSALYNYENGSRSVDVSTFLALCMVYRCENILDEFNDYDYVVSTPSNQELRLLEKIRELDSRGQALLYNILDFELQQKEPLNHTEK